MEVEAANPLHHSMTAITPAQTEPLVEEEKVEEEKEVSDHTNCMKTLTPEVDGIYNSGYRVLVDGEDVIASHAARPTARGVIKRN